MDLRSQKRRSFLSQPYGASTASLQRSLTQRSSLEASYSGPQREQSVASFASGTSRASRSPVPPKADLSFKIVVVGDGASGKTSLLTRYIRGAFPEAYIPTVFENDTKFVSQHGLTIELSLWDTAGQEEYDRLRALSYPDTDLFLLCFSVDTPMSLLNIKDKWLPEASFYRPYTPYIMVGLKSDLRQTLGSGLVSSAEAQELAEEWGVASYIECSARLNVNIDILFDMATTLLLEPHRKRSQEPIAAPTEGARTTPSAAQSIVASASRPSSRHGRVGRRREGDYRQSLTASAPLKRTHNKSASASAPTPASQPASASQPNPAASKAGQSHNFTESSGVADSILGRKASARLRVAKEDFTERTKACIIA